MPHYQILVASRERLEVLLTYSSPRPLKRYALVQVPLRDKRYKGVVIKPCSQPQAKFKVRACLRTSTLCLPEALVVSCLQLADRDQIPLSGVGRLLTNAASLAPPPAPTIKTTASPPDRLPLNQHQRQLTQAVLGQPTGQPQLLRGVTGSGKTHVYVRLANDLYRQGRSALILVPAIGLSQQIMLAFRNYYRGRVYHFHSRLTTKTRRDIWGEIHRQEGPAVVVGPRSASFLPLRNLGLIILDECHDDSFKQNSSPRYHCLHLASKLAQQHQAYFLAGSATPNVEDYYHYTQKGYPIHHLLQTALPSQKPHLQLAELPPHQNLSSVAQAALSQALEQNNQVLVFHNRRGSWRSAQCHHCRWRAQCPNCTGYLVLHADLFAFLCHYCHHRQPPLSSCPQCHQPVQYGQVGTKAFSQELKKLLLNCGFRVPIKRFDSDNIATDALHHKFQEVKQIRPLVMVGTSVIGQGLDLPHLQTIIIADVDQDLLDPDYRTMERNWRRIHQLLGRIGRGHLDQTSAILQTRNPQNPLLLDIKKGRPSQWQDFYHQELQRRQQAQLPPFSYIANIYVYHQEQKAAQQRAERLKLKLERQFPQVNLLGPSPSIKIRYRKKYCWIIHAFARRRPHLVEIKGSLQDGHEVLDLEPTHLFQGLKNPENT